MPTPKSKSKKKETDIEYALRTLDEHIKQNKLKLPKSKDPKSMEPLLKGMDPLAALLLSGMAPKDILRCHLIQQGDFKAELMPMKTFPDESINVDYQIVVYDRPCRFKECPSRDNYFEEYEGAYKRLDREDDRLRNIMKQALATACKKCDMPAPCGACCYAMIEHIWQDPKSRFKHGRMPDRSDVGRENEFQHLTYANVVGYIKVTFPERSEYDFAFAVGDIDHDT